MSIYGKIQELENKIDVVEAKANGQINNFTFTNVNATSVNVTSVTSSGGNFTSQLTASKLNVTSQLTASLAAMGNVDVSYAVTSSYINTIELTASNLSITSVTSSGGNFSSVLTASHLTGSQLTSSFANINQLTASLARVTNELTASKIYVSNALHFANGSGINFSKTNDAAGMTSETLKDYEEGVWTPVFRGNSIVGSMTTVYDGKYTKIGRMVYVSCYLIPDSVATAPVGSISISGLPYDVAGGIANLSAGTIGEFRDFLTPLIDIKAVFVHSSPTVALYKVTAAATSQNADLTNSDVSFSGTSSRLIFSGFYTTDD